jgi:hypothetical protein
MERTAKVIDKQHPLYGMICTVGPLVKGSDVHYVTVIDEPWHSGYARDEQLLFVEETPAERVIQVEQIARRLHTSLNDILGIFVERELRKYGQYSTLDEAFDALAESQEILHLPLTVGIAQIIEEKRKEK